MLELDFYRNAVEPKTIIRSTAGTKPSTPMFNSEIILRLLKNNWVLLLVFFSFGMLLAGITELNKTPQYLINGMLQVNNKQPINMDDYQVALSRSDGNKIIDTTPQSVVEMAILKSSYLLNKAIKDLKLEIDVRPKFFPVIGAHIYFPFNSHDFNLLHWDATVISLPLLAKYAWYGEHIEVNKFSVPQNLLDRNFTLRVDSENEQRYLLFYQNKLIMRGVVNKVCSNDRMGVLLQIGQLQARHGTEFILVRHSINYAYQSLIQNLQISEITGSQTVTEHTGIINITLLGNQPKFQAKIVNHLMALLIAKSLHDKVDLLVFMQKYVANKLIETESKVLIAQTAVSRFRASNRIIDRKTQEKLLVTNLDDINRQLAQNLVTYGSLENIYGKKHPLMRSIQRQYQELQQTQLAILRHVEQLPKQEAELAGLENNLSVQQNLRDALIKRNQALQILISGQLSDVRVLSSASAEGVVPENANIMLFILVGGNIGLIVGVIVILFIWLSRPINRYDDFEKATGIELKMVIKYCNRAHKYYADQNMNMLTRKDYREYSNLFRHHSSTAILELNKVVTELLLNTQAFRITGIMSLYNNAGASLIAHNLARELLLSGKKVALIHAINLEQTWSGINQLFNEVTGELIGHEFTPVYGLTTFMLNPDFRLNVYHEHLTTLITTINYRYDFIFVLDHGLQNNISRLINFTMCTSRYLVTTQQISNNQLRKDLEYLKQNNLEICGLFFNYNRQYFVHDVYSK